MNNMPGPRSLWVFDFDGTLSPIVPDRNKARLHRECERMLRFLVRSSWNRVAVLSSRALDDIVSRVPVPGVFVGGASGLEWQLPGGHQIRTGRRIRSAPCDEPPGRFPPLNRSGLRPRRRDRGQAVVRRGPLSERLAAFGSQESLPSPALEKPEGHHGVPGTEAVEVQMLGGGESPPGCAGCAGSPTGMPSRERIVYAGDDENDAVAIRWVLSKGGTGIVVGNRSPSPRRATWKVPPTSRERSGNSRVTAQRIGGEGPGGAA